MLETALLNPYSANFVQSFVHLATPFDLVEKNIQLMD
jgi:hypothetical protein